MQYVELIQSVVEWGILRTDTVIISSFQVLVDIIQQKHGQHN
jgi:hypothetical protein